MVTCPKCKTANAPENRRCQQCQSDLLPGEGIGLRLAYLGTFLGIAALGGFILYRMYSTDTWTVGSGCFLLSPVFWGFVVLVFPFLGLYYVLRTTPLHSRFVERAKRHISLDVGQAAADFNQALLLAPEKERAGILKLRADFFQKQGKTDHAALDRLNASLETGSYQGTEFAANLLGVDADIMKQGARSAEQARLLKESQVIPVGYCSKCRRAVQLDDRMRCLAHPRQRGTEVRFALPQDLVSIGTVVEQHHLDLVRKTRLRRGFGCVLTLVGAGVIFYLITRETIQVPQIAHQDVSSDVQTTPTAVEIAIFDQSDFRFEYPADWHVITPDDHPTLLNGSLKGLSNYEYIGGVYFKGLDNCDDCAQVVIVVFSDPSLPGDMTEEQFALAKDATAKQMGERLISYEFVTLDSQSAAESKHYGRSGDTQLWEYIILPSQPGIGYSFSMSADKSAYARFEPIFRDLVDSLQIKAQQPSIQDGPIQAATPAAIEQDSPVLNFAESILAEIKDHRPNFEDDFSVMSGRFVRWPAISPGVKFTEGIMRMKGQNWIGAGGKMLAEDFALEIAVKAHLISSDSRFNVTFRESDAGQYAFSCNLYDDSCEMVKILGKQGHPTSLIGAMSNTDPNEWRTILVIAQGDRFGFYINGDPFVTFRENTFGGDRVGIGLRSSTGPAEIAIDNVKFWDLSHLLP